jgi:hypothetical protein
MTKNVKKKTVPFWYDKTLAHQTIVYRPVSISLSPIGTVVVDEVFVEPYNHSMDPISDEFVTNLVNCYKRGCTKKTHKSTRPKNNTRLEVLTFDEIGDYINNRLMEIFSPDDIVDQPWNVYKLWDIPCKIGSSFREFVIRYMKKYFKLGYRPSNKMFVITDILTGYRFHMTGDEYKKSDLKLRVLYYY